MRLGQVSRWAPSIRSQLATCTDADAMEAGDVTMLEQEVTPVLKALRANGIDVVAIHHHMTGTRRSAFILHTTTPRDRLRAGARCPGSGRPAGTTPAVT